MLESEDKTTPVKPVLNNSKYLGLTSVGNHGSDDHRGADLGLKRQRYVEVQDVEEHAEQYGHGCCKTLHNVVSVFQNKGYQQSANALS